MAKYARIREQHLAVFGESGSGKTVLASSFYGPAQDKSSSNDLWDLVADDTGQVAVIRRVAALAVVSLLTLWALPASAQSQNWDWCAAKDGTTTDLQISGCTAIIQSGRENKKNLSIAFNNRCKAFYGWWSTVTRYRRWNRERIKPRRVSTGWRV